MEGCLAALSVLENCSRNFSEAMAPSREPSKERRCENNESAATVRIPEYNAEAPMDWFCSINATYAVSHVTTLITKFHWSLSKLPATLVDTIVPLWDDPAQWKTRARSFSALFCARTASANTRRLSNGWITPAWARTNRRFSWTSSTPCNHPPQWRGRRSCSSAGCPPTSAT
jgi:hypothetical protein